MNRLEFKQNFLAALSPLYDELECGAIFRLYVKDKLKIPYYQFCLEMMQSLPEPIHYDDDLKRLSHGEPIQYVLGRTVFCDLIFKTDARALIPRPETEELGGWVLQNNDVMGRLVDIGTGSGAIAVSLAHRWRNTDVFAIDISSDALELARENAELNGVTIDFAQMDILQDNINLPSLHIIISNQPYVPERHKKDLCTNVIDYEPYTALFVPDSNPLLFYDAIAKFASKHLNNNGKLYFETYQSFHSELVQMLSDYGFCQIKSRNDFAGKPRFISALWES